MVVPQIGLILPKTLGMNCQHQGLRDHSSSVRALQHGQNRNTHCGTTQARIISNILRSP